MRVLLGLVMLGVTLSFLPSNAGAQALVDRGYEVDLVDLPVFASGRVVSMGGAFVALAEGISSVPFNPAAYAVRNPREHSWFEWELSPSYSVGLNSNDLFNNGRGGTDVDNIRAFELGLRLQFGHLGVGVHISSQRYDSFIDDDLDPTTDDAVISTQTVRVHFGAAYEFFDGQLVIGGGAMLTVLNFSLDASNVDDIELFSFGGVGFEVGAVYRPVEHRYRLGVALRTPINSSFTELDPDEPIMSDQVALPSRVVQPLEIRIGGAYQFGPRPLNFRSFEAKDVEGRLERELRMRQCERALEQVVYEYEMAGRRLIPGSLQCPRLSVRPRDEAWIAAEQELQEQEEDELDDQIDDLEDERDERIFNQRDRLPRERYLLTGSLIFLGGVNNSVGLDAFFDQQRRDHRGAASFSFRLGFEMEPWANRLKVRGGTYLEPARTEFAPRLHATGGFDLRLFRWDFFGKVDPFDVYIGINVDGARDYRTWGLSVGLWH